MIQFLLNQELRIEQSIDPNMTVLNYLRRHAGKRGTKEGCGSGDCGACTVVVAEADGDQLRYKSLNACITFISVLHGKQLITVDDLQHQHRLHPAQQVMVDYHASQCGFCTPGFVMSLFALSKNSAKSVAPPSKDRIEQALSGNLCRCTGYRPILDAAQAMSHSQQPDQFDRHQPQTLDRLRGLQSELQPQLSDGCKHAFNPRSLDELAALFAANPSAHLFAGGTDLALAVTQRHQQLDTLIYVGDIDALKRVQVFDDRIELGAAASLTDGYQALAADYADFGALLHRFGSLQIRNQGTFGGNIGNASPIADSPPALIALGAEVVLRQGGTSRTLKLEDYFVDYKVTALQPAEFIAKLIVPRAKANGAFRCYKLTKRIDDDTSAVLGCFNLKIEAGTVRHACVAFGGMAAIPKRAERCEAVLTGAPWNRATIKRAKQALRLDFDPISDFRASQQYRMLTACNMLSRYFVEIDSPEVDSRVMDRSVIGDYLAAQQQLASAVPDPPVLAKPGLQSGVGRSVKHDSAIKHVSGAALYVDDRLEFPNQLHLYARLSDCAHGRITKLDVGPCYDVPGVALAITASDIPGQLDIGAVLPGDPLLADGTIEFYGQPLLVVAAADPNSARTAAMAAIVEYQTRDALLSVEQALEEARFVGAPHHQQRGDSQAALANARHRISGSVQIGGQDHFYLETQVASAIPTEDGGMIVHSSTQNPSEMQKLVATVLGIPLNRVQIETRRMGGGFGGKETQSAGPACLAAVVARLTSRPAKMRLPRREDMLMTGKRHPFYSQFQVGFDDDGRIHGYEITLTGNCGYSPDLSNAVIDRAMFHTDNAYYLGDARISGYRCQTHTASNTAFRGFGGPQGMLMPEIIMDAIARRLGQDPLAVRKHNLYHGSNGIHETVKPGDAGRDTTHYYQKVEDNPLPQMIAELETSSDYQRRRDQIRAYNAASPILKKGLALTPVKFGISFTATFLNQAGALLHIYTDGSIHLNHGGTEMGQGLNTKVAQIVAEALQVDFDTIQISATNTHQVPNSSPTAASSGADLNGKAAQNAALTIKQRLVDFAVSHFSVTDEDVRFVNNQVLIRDVVMAFADFIRLAYVNRVSLSSTGFYRTPKIYYDRAHARGRPFYYFAYGAACSEVVIDTLTGETKILRVDLLHDVGASLNPAIDTGQIEGAFVQGAGWLTSEELVWDDQGRLQTDGPASYKIPTVTDIPVDFRVKLVESRANTEDTVFHSKAVGEPPLMLAISVFCAIKDAISSLSGYRISPDLDVPATPERVLWAIEAIRSGAKRSTKPERRHPPQKAH